MATDFDPNSMPDFLQPTLETAPTEPNAAAPTEAVPTTPAVTDSPTPAKPAKPAKVKPPKPPLNVYTVMLMLSMLFLALGSAVLLIELRRYGFEIRPGFRMF